MSSRIHPRLGPLKVQQDIQDIDVSGRRAAELFSVKRGDSIAPLKDFDTQYTSNSKGQLQWETNYVRAFAFAGAVLLLAASTNHAHASAPLDPLAYLPQRGWTPASEKPPRSPNPDLAPLQYTKKPGMGASCSLLERTSDGKPNDLPLAGPEGDDAWPDCIGIESMVAFTLQGRDLIAISYLVRDTRDDYYCYVDYIYRDQANKYVIDDDLGVTLNGHPAIRHITRTPDVVPFAHAKQLAKRYKQWHFHDSHFIADPHAWFAILQHSKAEQCRILVHAAGKAKTFDQPGCRNALATTRLEKAGVVYYLAMFELQGRQRHIAVMTVAADGRISAATALTNAVNRGGAAKDIRSARYALAKALQ